MYYAQVNIGFADAKHWNEDLIPWCFVRKRVLVMCRQQDQESERKHEQRGSDYPGKP